MARALTAERGEFFPGSARIDCFALILTWQALHCTAYTESSIFPLAFKTNYPLFCLPLAAPHRDSRAGLHGTASRLRGAKRLAIGLGNRNGAPLRQLVCSQILRRSARAFAARTRQSWYL